MISNSMILKRACSLVLLAIHTLGAQARGLASGRVAGEGIVDPSFGHSGNLWGSRAPGPHIAGWNLFDEHGYRSEVLSDRVILTPPHPGGRRGAVWAEEPTTLKEWTVDVEFRASGDERGSGNLQVWYAKDGFKTVGSGSIYTAGKFDGLAIVVSPYAGRGGSVRGFLNDGTNNYHDRDHVDRLAFGNCDFAYRNLGRFSTVTLKQTAEGLEVLVDAEPCFKAPQILLPPGYEFGVTAASAENPDSFEVKSFITKVPAKARQEINTRDKPKSAESRRQQTSSKQGADTSPNESSWLWITGESKNINNSPASSFESESQRFEDLHNRLSLVSTALDFLYNDLTTLKAQTEARHVELMHRLERIQDSFTSSSKREQSGTIDQNIEDMKQQLRSIKDDVASRDYRSQLELIERAVTDSHQTIMSGVPDAMTTLMSTHGPSTKFVILAMFACQGLLVGGYVIYKRQKHNQPKKFL